MKEQILRLLKRFAGIRLLIIGSVISLAVNSAALAATYNLSLGQFPPCNTNWVVSDNLYRCVGNGRVTLESGDILTANADIIIEANNGFSFTNNTIGTAANNISIQSTYGSIVATGTNIINGSVTAAGAPVTLSGTTVNGSITAGSPINLTGGSVTGLVRSSSHTVTTNGTNLQSGVTANSGISITGGIVSGPFTMTSNNPATFSGVTMTSGSITAASTVLITNGSTLGSPSNSITISSTAGAITVNNSTVYGALTAPNWSVVNVTNGAAVYGTCLPRSEPANACTTASTLLGSWRMDEPYWNGTANEVIDSSGNNNHGRARIAAGSTPTASTALVSPALTVGSQSTCSYGQFDSISAPVRTFTYVELSGFPALPNSFTFTAWIRSTNASAQHQRILVRDDAQNGWGLSLADGTGEPRLRFYNRNIQNTGTVIGHGRNGECGVFCLDTNAVIQNNAWHFIAAAIDTAARTVTLYVYNANGALLARTQGSFSGNWLDGTGTAAIGGETLASGEGQQSSFHFLGNIDEMEIYTGALGQSYIETLRARVRTCPPISPHHYELHIPASGISCMATPVTVVACADSSNPCTNSYLAAGGTTATLTTSAGVLANTTLTFNSGGVATTILSHPTAANGAPAAVTLSGEQLPGLNPRRCCQGGTGCPIANSCTTVFNTAGLAFATSTTPNLLSIPNQVAGTIGTTPILRAVQTNTTTGACQARVTGTRTVQMGYECRNPTSCVTGQTFTVNGTAVQPNNNNAAITYSNVSLTFDGAGTASIPLNYSDVGRVRMHSRLPIAASGQEPAVTLTGTSNEFVVKPHTLAVSSVPGNPATTATGAGFVAAGQAFSVQIEARNALGNRTPNFGNEVISERTHISLEPVNLVYPTGGTLGVLGGAGPGTFVATTPAGTLVNTTVTWNEVGSLTLRPQLSDNDYLGAGDLASLTTSGTIGRFFPHQFQLIPVPAATPVADSCSGFTYMSHPAMGFNFDIEARNLDGVRTANYRSTYSNKASLFYVAENADDGINLGARISLSPIDWVDGLLRSTASDGAFMRQASTAPDGPFTNMQFGVGLIDSLDNRQLQGRNMNPSTTGNCGASCTAVALGTPRIIRYGRLRLDDAFGPESVDLPVRFRTEFWNGSFFTQSATDNCTLIPRTAISYPSGNLANDTNRTLALNGGSTQGRYANLDATGVLFTSGDAGHFFAAPGTGTGNFVVNVNLVDMPWLRFDWNQNGNFSDDAALPPANFGFGQYRGHDRIIYWREELE